MAITRNRIDWVNVIFFIVTPIIGMGGALLLATRVGVPWQTWLLAGLYLISSGLAITGGYHRLFAHRSYQAALPIRLFYLFFGSAAFQGSCLWWAAEHRVHHRFEDTDRDPYGIQKGFWYAHIGWLLEKREDASLDNVRDLKQDRWLVWQQRLYIPIAIITCFLVPMGLGALWGDALGALVIAGCARMVINHHVTFSINSFCHFVGRKSYNDALTARDSWFTALLTWGEGYHNFHHAFQYDYRNAIRPYQWDPTKWLINCLAWLGLAGQLRRANRFHIMEVRLTQDQEQFSRRLSQYSDSARRKAQELLTGTKERLEAAHTQFVELKREYRRLRRERIDTVSSQLKQLRQEMREARREFRQALKEWYGLIHGPIAVPV